MKNLGMILLGIWLILVGIAPIIHLNFTGMSTLVAILAIIAGVLLLLDQAGGRTRFRNIGWLLLSLYLILGGLIPLFRIRFSGSDIILAVLAIAAGILILLKK